MPIGVVRPLAASAHPHVHRGLGGPVRPAAYQNVLARTVGNSPFRADSMARVTTVERVRETLGLDHIRRVALRRATETLFPASWCDSPFSALPMVQRKNVFLVALGAPVAPAPSAPPTNEVRARWRDPPPQRLSCFLQRPPRLPYRRGATLAPKRRLKPRAKEWNRRWVTEEQVGGARKETSKLRRELAMPSDRDFTMVGETPSYPVENDVLEATNPRLGKCFRGGLLQAFPIVHCDDVAVDEPCAH